MQVQHELRCLALLVTSFASSVMANGAPQQQLPLTKPTTITQVAIGRIGEQAVARITADRPLLPHTLRLSNPDRLVLDFANARLGPVQTPIASGQRPIREIRLGQFKPDVARVVVDLEAMVPYSIMAEGQSITVVFASVDSASSDTPMPKTMSTGAPGASGTAPSVVSEQPVAAPAKRTLPQQETAAPANAFENGMLTFSAQDQSLRSILEQIEDLANVAVVISADLGNQRISAQFRHYRLDEALRQILRDYNALFLYRGLKDGDGVDALQTVWVYPANQGPEINHDALSAWKANERHIEQTLTAVDPNERARAVDSLIRREGSQAVNVVLDALKDPSDKVRHQALYRAALVGAVPPEDTLIDLALNDEWAEVRLWALQALPVDPTLRWVSLRALNDSSPQVVDIARDIIKELDAALAPPTAQAAVQP